MGVLDLPAPLLSDLDYVLSEVVPPVVRLLLWAALGAILSMELYRLLSPQPKIADLRIDLEDAKRKLSDYDGELGDALPLIRRMLSLAFRRILVVLPATLAAGLPILALIVWLDSTYGYTWPPSGQSPTVEVQAPFKGAWRDAQGGAPHAVVTDDGGNVVVDAPVEAAIPILHKRRWWNLLIGNPAGYLDRDAPIETIAIDLPRLEVMPTGPEWLRGWEASFFLALVLFSLAFKWARRIE